MTCVPRSLYFSHNSHTNTDATIKLIYIINGGLFIRRNAISLKKQFPNTDQKHNYMFETRNMYEMCQRPRLGCIFSFSFDFSVCVSVSASGSGLVSGP